jgi:hypothetical protein
MYNNRLENNFISGQDVEVIKRTRSERQNYEELANEFRQKLKSTISTSELEKLSKGTNASLKTIQSAILVQGTYLKNIAGSIKNIEAMQKKILQATMPSIKAPTMKKVTDKDRLDIISKSKGFTDFNKSVSDFGSSLTKLIEAQKSNNNEVLAALGMVPKNTSDMISKAFGKFILDNPRMVWLFNLLDKTVGTGARWMIDLGKELSQFNGGFFHKVFGLLSLRQRGAWTTEIQYNPAMPLQSIMSTLNAIHKNVWLINHETMPGMKKAPQELHMEKGTLKAILDQMPPHYKRIAGVLAAIGGVYFPSQMAKFGLWLPKVLGKSVLSILTNRTIMNAALTFAKSPIMTAFALTSFSSLWENIIGSRRDAARERERTRRRAQTDRSNRDRRFVADRNSNDNDVYYYTHDRSEGYWGYVGEEIARAFPKFMEKGFSETFGNIWGALTNQSAIRSKRAEDKRKQDEEDNIELQHEILNMINVNRAHVEDFVMHGADNLRDIQIALTGGANAARNAITSSVQENLRHIRNSLVDRNRAPILRQILRRLTTISSNVNTIITGTRTGRNGTQTRITLGNTGELLYGANNGISRAAAFVGSGATTTFGDVISDKFDTTNYLLTFILKEIRRASGGSGGRRNRNRNNNNNNNNLGLAGQVDPSFDADPVVATYLNSLLARADHYNDAIIGPDGNKIADPFGNLNNSSGAKRKHPPILVQDDGKNGVDLSILDRGDNIIAVRSGSAADNAIQSAAGFGIGSMISNWASSDYSNIHAKGDSFLNADVFAMLGNTIKGGIKGYKAAPEFIKNSVNNIKSAFSGGGNFLKNAGAALSNAFKTLKEKSLWDGIKMIFKGVPFLWRIAGKTWTKLIRDPWHALRKGLASSVDYLQEKIIGGIESISSNIAEKFAANKIKNTAMLGGFGLMSYLPTLFANYAGVTGENISKFLESDTGELIIGLVSAFGGKLGGFTEALKLGMEWKKTWEDIGANGFDIAHVGDMGWTISKGILGSLASIFTTDPKMMSIVGEGMDALRDGVSWLYGDSIDHMNELWAEAMHNFDKNGFFGENTMRSGLKAMFETLALPFGQTAMNTVGDWWDGLADWYDEKSRGLAKWWEDTKEWLSDEFELLPTRFGGLAYTVLDVIREALRGSTMFNGVSEGLDSVMGNNSWLKRARLASDLNVSTSLINEDLVSKREKLTDLKFIRELQSLGEQTGKVFSFDRDRGIVSKKSLIGVGGAVGLINVDHIKKFFPMGVSIARKLKSFGIGTAIDNDKLALMCSEYIAYNPKFKEEDIKDKLSAQKLFSSMLMSTRTQNLTKDEAVFIMANDLGEINERFAATGHYLYSHRNDMSVNDIMDIYDYRKNNANLSNLDIVTGNNLKNKYGVDFESDVQRKSVLEDMRKSGYSFDGKDEATIQKDVAVLKDMFNIKRLDKLNDENKKQFIVKLQDFIRSPEFRAAFFNDIVKGGNEGLTKFSNFLRIQLLNLAESCGYKMDDESAKSLEGVINNLIGEVSVYIANKCHVDNPESYRNFLQVKWEMGKGYLINIKEDILAKFRNSDLYKTWEAYFGEKKRKEYKSTLFKASDKVYQYASPYVSSLASNLNIGMDTAKNMTTQLLSMLGLSDAAFKLENATGSLRNMADKMSIIDADKYIADVKRNESHRNVNNIIDANLYNAVSELMGKDDLKDRMIARITRGKGDAAEWLKKGRKGYCAAGLKELLYDMNIFSNTERNASGHAEEMAPMFKKNANFTDVTDMVTNKDIAKLPPGYVVVLDKKKAGKNEHGHVFMTIGGGQEVSDHIQNMGDYSHRKVLGVYKMDRAYDIKDTATAKERANADLMKAGIASLPYFVQNEMDILKSPQAMLAKLNASANAIGVAPYATGIPLLISAMESANEELASVQKESSGYVKTMSEKLDIATNYLKNIAEKTLGNTTIVAPNNSTTVHSTSNTSNNNNSAPSDSGSGINMAAINAMQLQYASEAVNNLY